MIREETQVVQSQKSRHTIGFKKSFLRSLFTSITATSVDFVISVICAEFLMIYYVTSTTIGGLFGAATSFFLGRVWVFKKKNGRLTNQLIRFLFTNVFSIFLNTSGVFFIVETFDLSFVWSRVWVASFVGFFFNFLMNRYFVFRS